MLVVTAVIVGTAHAAPFVNVFDRTFVCTTGEGGPLISGNPVVDQGRIPGGVSVNRTFTGGSRQLVVAGTYYPGLRSGALVDREHCKRSANTVPLTRKGLPGPPAGRGSVRCPLGRVLVRLRYTYVPGPHPAGSEVGGDLVSAVLAVRSYRTLKPLAFVSLTANGEKLQLYSAASCRVA